jgi:hypothetical protein
LTLTLYQPAQSPGAGRDGLVDCYGAMLIPFYDQLGDRMASTSSYNHGNQLRTELSSWVVRSVGWTVALGEAWRSRTTFAC